MRVLVAFVAIVALLLAFLLAYKVSLPGKVESRRHYLGVATARVLVDTPSSQVISVAPRGSDTLGVRANLMASLMVDGVIKSAIAQRVGLPLNGLVGIAENADDGTQPADPPAGRAVNVLRTSVLQDTDGNQLPIIQIQTQAQDAARAAQLANAAVDGLRAYLDTRAAVEQVPDARRLRVHGLGAAQASEVSRGPSLMIALTVAILLFAAGCALILGVVALIRNWRMVGLEEEEEEAAVAFELIDEMDAPAPDDGADEADVPPGSSWRRRGTPAHAAADARSLR
jgi:hypothetical protein